MDFVCLTDKRQVRRLEKNLEPFRGLEPLETRLLMAADLAAAVMDSSPQSVAVQVDSSGDKWSKADKSDASGRFSYSIDSWVTRNPLKVKVTQFTQPKKAGPHQGKQESTSEQSQEQALAELDRLFSTITRSTANYRQWIGDWASKYAALSASLRPEMAKQTAIDVLKGFGEEYSPDSSEIFAFKTTGSDSFSEAYTHLGNNAAISDLKLWRSGTMESKLQSAGVGSDIETYIYTGRFGDGPNHVGTAVARSHWAGTEIVFLPMAVVKVDGLSAKDAAAFFAQQLDGKGDFTDFVRNRHGEQQPAGQVYPDNPIRRTSRWGCDYEALAACSAEILDTLESELEAAREAHDQSVNQLMDQYADDATGGLAAGLIAGAIPGALFGAAGGPIGALIWGLAGAIGGAVAAMTIAANNADDLREALDAADDDYAEAVCQAKGRAIDSLLECIREHCPDALEAAELWAEQQFNLEGCVLD